MPDLRWVDSRGGPLLVLPQDLLSSWEGIEPPSGGRVVSAAFRWSDPGSPATDYDRACDIADRVGNLDVGFGKALVLADEPMSTMWWPQPGSGILVRWQWADDDASVVRALAKVSDVAWESTACRLSVAAMPLVLFDAAVCGRDALREDHLLIELPPGHYEVQAADLRPDESTSLIIYRLSPL